LAGKLKGGGVSLGSHRKAWLRYWVLHINRYSERYESGINRLNVEGIQLIADALSMPVSYFFEPDKTSMVAEGPSSYLPTEKGKLLGYFRKIKDSSSKDLVIQVARLAAKVNEQSSQ